MALRLGGKDSMKTTLALRGSLAALCLALAYMAGSACGAPPSQGARSLSDDKKLDISFTIIDKSYMVNVSAKNLSKKPIRFSLPAGLWLIGANESQPSLITLERQDFKLGAGLSEDRQIYAFNGEFTKGFPGSGAVFSLGAKPVPERPDLGRLIAYANSKPGKAKYGFAQEDRQDSRVLMQSAIWLICDGLDQESRIERLVDPLILSRLNTQEGLPRLMAMFKPEEIEAIKAANDDGDVFGKILGDIIDDEAELKARLKLSLGEDVYATAYDDVKSRYLEGMAQDKLDVQGLLDAAKLKLSY